MVFPILHQDEIQAGGSLHTIALAQGAPGMFQLPDIQPVEQSGPFRTVDWNVAQDTLLATKDWSKKGAKGVIMERGSFEFRHTPT